MNIDDLAIKSANTQRGGLVPSSTGLTPDALPEVQKNSFGRELKHRGTTKNALSGTGKTTLLHLKQRILIGTLYVLLTEEKRKHTTILK